MGGILHLTREGIRFSGICVLTSDSLHFPDELFAFFHQLGAQNVGFNVEEIEGAHTSSSLVLGITDDDYLKFFRRFYSLWKDGGKPFKVREFDKATALILRGAVYEDRGLRPANGEVTPLTIISVDCDGNFSTFSPELLGQRSVKYGNFLFGNVNNDGFTKLGLKQEFRRAHNDINEGVKMCAANCQYFAICGGGSPINKYYEHNTFKATLTLHCRCSLQIPVSVVLEDLESTFGVQHQISK
jgi:uncharacterized protein